MNLLNDQRKNMRKLNYIISNQNTIKFACLNDNIEHSSPCAAEAKQEIVNQFYEVLFKNPSKFERENITELTVTTQLCTTFPDDTSYLMRTFCFFVIMLLIILKFKRKLFGKIRTITTFRQKTASY